MNIKSLVAFLKGSIDSKYEIIESDGIIKGILELDEHSLIKNAIRLKRVSAANAKGEKTVLIIEIQYIEQVNFAIKWSAIVKDSLLDPETFDLYLIIIFSNNILTIEESIRIESSDHICKKYVQREDETAEELVNRTFLASIKNDSIASTINDPIRKSLLSTSIEHNWLTQQIQNEWKQHFLSNATGIDLVDLLIPEIKDNYEVSQ